MKLSLKGFPDLVEDMGAALQSAATSLVDVSVGSVIRAIFEANASVVLWLQWLILQVLQTTRAATSSGTDLDSWMMDFGQTRLSAAPSTGIVTFSRYAANVSAIIPAGTIVKTTDGSLSFAVTAEASLSIWSPASSGYLLPNGVASVDLPVICTTAGTTGNVLAGTINVIASSLPGVDQVNNNSPLANGIDAESDQAFRGRFQSYLASQSRATLAAVRYAVGNVRQGLDVAVAENTNSAGNRQIGSFLVIVDDGSGYPSSDLLSGVASAVELVRPVGTTFAVVPPQVLTVNAELTVELTTVEAATLCIPSIQNYVANYLDSLPIGKTASITRIAQNAYLAGAQVINVTGIKLNDGSSDIAAPPFTVLKAGQIVVTTDDR